jgi:hypothetical protein
MSPVQARTFLDGLPKVPVTRDNALLCLLPQS